MVDMLSTFERQQTINQCGGRGALSPQQSSGGMVQTQAFQPAFTVVLNPTLSNTHGT